MITREDVDIDETVSTELAAVRALAAWVQARVAPAPVSDLELPPAEPLNGHPLAARARLPAVPDSVPPISVAAPDPGRGGREIVEDLLDFGIPAPTPAPVDRGDPGRPPEPDEDPPLRPRAPKSGYVPGLAERPDGSPYQIDPLPPIKPRRNRTSPPPKPPVATDPAPGTDPPGPAAAGTLEAEPAPPPVAAADKPKRGRKPGSKTRPPEVREAERAAKAARKSGSADPSLAEAEAPTHVVAPPGGWTAGPELYAAAEELLGPGPTLALLDDLVVCDNCDTLYYCEEDRCLSCGTEARLGYRAIAYFLPGAIPPSALPTAADVGSRPGAVFRPDPAEKPRRKGAPA